MKTINIICDILQHELSLSDGQIMTYNQRFAIPPNLDNYITVGFIGSKPYANNLTYVGTNSDLQESQYIVMAELISINIMSATTAVMDLYPDVLMALNSTYAAQQQGVYQFRVGVVPTAANDTSFLEATSQVTRQTVTLQCLRSYSKMKSTDFYDTFTDEILTEKGPVV